MSMGDLSQGSDLHSMRREQERERRRMRDRERRQSMTEEQRQMLLARRRKNYQLRRQKVKHLEEGYQSGHRDTASGSEIGERIEEQEIPDASELGLNCNVIIPPAGIDHVLQKMNTEERKSGGSEPLAYDLAKFHRRLRLSHVKHFARSLKHPIFEFNKSGQQVHADIVVKEDPAASCKSTQGIRLNSIKRLARTVKNGFKEDPKKQHRSERDVIVAQEKGEVQLGINQPDLQEHTRKIAAEVTANITNCTNQ
ncbi:hypothetical protein SAY87_010267 [Trapa incisa]|uniref:Uncharacterized protein n=1 Tax=Trapa incisa TaxID=236973 RepID=A0AAN7GJ86_9MYRT|nr:hypothetical protein SAY87_010267 [Trapa incisa]